MFEAIRAKTQNTAPSDTATSRDMGRSRQEDRTVEVFPAGDALAETEWRPFIKTIIRVRRHTTPLDAIGSGWGRADPSPAQSGPSPILRRVGGDLAKGGGHRAFSVR
ncbi:hypothetical protein, partial [Azospirillum sp.]|uniref:hypothetical protein n=1 Tax=Azospirillum sp. TaxID=34012 RepID=UPI00260C197B